MLLGAGFFGTPDQAQANGEPEMLDPTTIPKYQEPLIIPPAMPPQGQGPLKAQDGKPVKYKIAVRQFDQQVLPTGMPMTTVWGYGRMGDPLPGSGMPSTYNFPAFTIETRTNQTLEVTWANYLVDDPDAEEYKNYLPHLLPVDQTLHWANPPGPRDTRGTAVEPYTGPVPIVTHVHGAHVADHSDGYPEAWYLPNASNIPDDYFTEGTFYGGAKKSPKGSAVFEYSNDQRATTLWYHDHALGITRLNVYAGMAGFWLVRDDVEDSLNLPGPAPQLGDAPGTKYYEVPIVIQDRSFNDDGSWFYPDTREFFDEYGGPYFPATDISPIWNPEFFGNAMVVNGRTWPYLEVEPRLYRFRFLNGCNSRFLALMADDDLTFHLIGTEGGLIPGEPLELDWMLMSPAERMDVIVDFSDYEPGDEITLLNFGPDEPFKGLPLNLTPGVVSNPATTGQVMKFVVVEETEEGNYGEIPEELPDIDDLGTADNERYVTLNEEVSQFADIPIAALLGTDEDGPLTWADEITEDPVDGDVEVWKIVNLTEDAHPIHLHLVMFQVISRQPFDAEAYSEAQEEYLSEGGDVPDPVDFVTGPAYEPYPWESGWKDTVTANPGELTRITALFDLPGLYVWHCHILEHEDNEMMRPYRVLEANGNGNGPPGPPDN
jgi:FtsP/CotA-like multicopper oxidase with cupredoxin domain